MADSETSFCRECASKKLSEWRGWPYRDPPVPYLEPLKGEDCPGCGSDEQISESQIYWFNVHEENNTGLPDYWLLKIDADPWYAKWGRPYNGVMKCQTCNKPATISKRQSGSLRVNCENCGTIKP